MSADRIVHVAVAGVPRGYQNPEPGGRWLRDYHLEQIQGVSSGIQVTHTTRSELDEGILPEVSPEVLLIEVGGDEWYYEEIPAEAFAKLITPRLRWIQLCSSGVTHVLATRLVAEDHLLTNAAGVHAVALGESATAAVLMHAKRLRQRWANQQTRTWAEIHCDELRGATMVVLGTGHIGKTVGRLARAFRMRTVGVRRNPGPVEHFDEVVGSADLHSVLPQADYLVIACPLTPETEGMIGPAEFAAIKRDAYVINVSRGKVVQELAMLDSLRDGTLSGAFLDAHAQEPLADDHPFWTEPNVTLIPHDSHSSPYIGDNIVDLFTDNLRRYLAGESLRNLVDRQRGY